MGFAVLGLGFAVPGLGFAVLGLGSVRRAWWPQKEATNINVGLRSSGAGLRGFAMRRHGFRVELCVWGFGFRARRNWLSPVTFRENMTDISKT